MIRYNQRGDLGNQLSRLEHQSEEHPTFFSFLQRLSEKRKTGGALIPCSQLQKIRRGSEKLMNMQKIYYDMAEKLRPYAEPYMDKLSKEAVNSAIRAGEPSIAIGDYLAEAWLHKSAPKELLIEAYNLLEPYECGDIHDDIADDLGLPRKVDPLDE